MDGKMGQKTVRVLLLNPNSSAEMTHGMQEAIQTMDLPKSLVLSTYTAPASSPASINDGGDLAASTAAVLAAFDAEAAAAQYDAILVACFSVHPLVRRLRARLRGVRGGAGRRVVVTGIFEASVLTALALLPPDGDAEGEDHEDHDDHDHDHDHEKAPTWGIVTTGRFWEAHLAAGARAFLGQADPRAANGKFAGVYSTGLDAGDFHGGVAPEVIRAKLKEATRRLLTAGAPVACVVMGCAGMAGLEAIVREAAAEQYGAEAAGRLCVVDGVKAGVGLLDQTVQNVRLFQK